MCMGKVRNVLIMRSYPSLAITGFHMNAEMVQKLLLRFNIYSTGEQ